MRWVLITVATLCALVVAAAASVYLYNQASLRNDRIRLREARLELHSAVWKRQDRERILDTKNPGRPFELPSERRARYGADATWRDLEKKAADREDEVVVILDRWPELR